MKRFWHWIAVIAALVYCGLFGSVTWLEWWQDQQDQQAKLAEPDRLVSSLRLLPKPQGKLTPTDLASGEHQVEQMVADRPKMKRYVQKGDPVWRYCVRQFAGEAVGKPIYWHNEPPEGPTQYTADHQDPTDTLEGFIRVRKVYTTGARLSQERDGEELWHDALFELNNIRNAKQFNRVYEDALAGKVDKQGWIKGYTSLEYKACRDTIHVYEAIWAPAMKRKGISPNPDCWALDLPDTYEAWIALYTDPKGYPFDCYGTYYDEQIVPYRKQMEVWERSNRQ